MSNHSVIEHRANYHYIKTEEDYVLICSNGKANPHCKALILAILENWTNNKTDKGEDLYIYMTYPEWAQAMYGFFGRNIIINCLNELVTENMVARRACHRGGKDSYEYILNISVVQNLIKALPERNEKECRPNLNAFKNKRVQKQTADDSLPFKNKRENEDLAFKKGRYIYTNNIDTNNIASENVVTAHADDAPSQKNLVETPEPQSKPSPKEDKPSKGKTTGKKSNTAISPEELEIRKKLHIWIDSHRGYSLSGRALKGEVLQENTACVTLANLLYRGIHLNDPSGCTWEELEAIWNHIARYDKYWSQPSNKERIGGKTLLQMFAPTIGKIRKQIQATSNNQANGGRQLSEMEKRNREMAARFSRRNASGQ